MTIELEDVEPTGEAMSAAFVDRRCDSHWSGIRGSVERISRKIYPRSLEGKLLREMREGLGLSMGDAARALGLSVVEVSAIETGSKRPKHQDGWAQIEAVMREAKEKL